ncbi:hypothetical protein NNA33_19795 [Marisediminitalea aggregata]|uniref:hypothetical protein n=1 Tax=Marisediminitalea aggregata TaxID=634436 RepID=UPI0020CD2561|nr:hypothetical protein [Marisediminitalea aggregata]MCP9480138.1 hypothetical protein [Marisediminitalea aggregata]
MKELSPEELQCVAGGEINWGQAAAAAGIIALGVAVVATGGIASIPISLAGAATAGELTIAGFGIAASAFGGWGIGDAVSP